MAAKAWEEMTADEKLDVLDAAMKAVVTRCNGLGQRLQMAEMEIAKLRRERDSALRK